MIVADDNGLAERLGAGLHEHGQLCVVAPPITGPGFAAPPRVPCFPFVAPPTAFWAAEGQEKAIAHAPSSITVTIALFFMGLPFV